MGKKNANRIGLSFIIIIITSSNTSSSSRISSSTFNALAWSVEFLPSNPAPQVPFPAESEILISILGVCPLI